MVQVTATRSRTRRSAVSRARCYCSSRRLRVFTANRVELVLEVLSGVDVWPLTIICVKRRENGNIASPQTSRDSNYVASIYVVVFACGRREFILISNFVASAETVRTRTEWISTVKLTRTGKTVESWTNFASSLRRKKRWKYSAFCAGRQYLRHTYSDDRRRASREFTSVSYFVASACMCRRVCPCEKWLRVNFDNRLSFRKARWKVRAASILLRCIKDCDNECAWSTREIVHVAIWIWTHRR